MSQKRKHSDVADGGHGAPHSKRRRPFGPGGQHKGRPRRGKTAAADDERKTDSTSALKSRIRNLTRLLGHVEKDEKNKMPVTVRNERERELEACRRELAEKQAADREAEFRNKIIGKYHHVRFFERQKATRIVKRLTKQLSTTEDDAEKASLRSKIHSADVDVNYTIYYPLLKPYVSLFPKPKDSTEPANEPGPRGDVDMWRAIEKAMAKGSLEQLRNSKEGVVIPNANQQAKKNTKAVAPDEDDEDSDSDFFE